MRANCLTLLALAATFGAVSCHKRVPVTVIAPPPVAPTPVSEAPAVPPPPPVSPPRAVSAPPAVSALDQADAAFNSGAYDEAARGYEYYWRTAQPDAKRRDEALFRLALTFVLRPAPATDWQRAAATFKQLIEQFPDSPLKPTSRLILSLREEADQFASDVRQRDQRIKQLNTELDRLIKIDAERRKRP